MQRVNEPLPKKYIVVNGVMSINPAYTAAKAGKGEATTVANPAKALAIISTVEEMKQASDEMMLDKTIGKPIQVADSQAALIDIMQDPEYLAKFKAPTQIDNGDLLDKIYVAFAKYEIPIGLLNKLFQLSEYKLDFTIDDSGSMVTKSDLTFAQATPYMHRLLGGRNPATTALSRWEEAEDRLHILIDLIGYIPTNGIVIRYLNELDSKGNKNVPLILNQQGRTPEDFIVDAHNKIMQFFTKRPIQSTPIKHALTQRFNEAKEQTMLYLFTDGEPSDARVDQVAALIKNRPDPSRTPLTLISCSDQDREIEWMKKIEEAAPYVSEMDDFSSESKEVLQDQGPVFPYSKGMWLICNLVSAICPDDLDAIDESAPFTKSTLDNLLGRKLNLSEYQAYFINKPNSAMFNPIYAEFIREDVVTRTILDGIRAATGIRENKDINDAAVAHFAVTLLRTQPAASMTAAAPQAMPSLALPPAAAAAPSWGAAPPPYSVAMGGMYGPSYQPVPTGSVPIPAGQEYKKLYQP